MIEAVARLLPGFMGNAESLVEESHQEGLLEYPQWTRPPEWRGREVPEVLLSGNHGKIARWHDYSNISNITDNAPAWWIERIMQAATGQ